MSETGKKYTVVGRHVGCRSYVENPGARIRTSLQRHLIERGDEHLDPSRRTQMLGRTPYVPAAEAPLGAPLWHRLPWG
jgi:hypothetical protein